MWKDYWNPSGKTFRRLNTIALEDAPAEFADNHQLGFFYKTYKEFVKAGPEKTNENIKKMVLGNPELTNWFANQAYDIGNNKPKMSDRQKDFRKILFNDAANGNIPPPTSSLEQLLGQAPAGAVAGQIRSELTEALKAGKDRDKVFEDKLGGLDKAVNQVMAEVEGIGHDVETINKDIAQLKDEFERRALVEKRQAKIAEQRAGISVAATLIGLVDPKAGQFIDVVGNSYVTASQAAIDLAENGLSFVATGNLIGAGMAVVNLLQNNPDPASERHKQIMGILTQIGEQLAAVQKQLGVIDEKLGLVLQDVDKIHSGQIVQTEVLIQHFTALERSVSLAQQSARTDVREKYFNEFRDVRIQCENRFEYGGAILGATSNDVNDYKNCLSKYQGFGLNHSTATAFSYSDFLWSTGGAEALYNLNGPIDYLGALPDLLKPLELPADKFNPGLAAGLRHPLPVAQAVSAFVELRMRRPEFTGFPDEAKVLNDLNKSLADYEDLVTKAGVLLAWDDNSGRKAYEKQKAVVLQEIIAVEDAYIRQTLNLTHNRPNCRLQKKAEWTDTDWQNCLKIIPRLSALPDGPDAWPSDVSLQYVLLYGHYDNIYIGNVGWNWQNDPQPSSATLGTTGPLTYFYNSDGCITHRFPYYLTVTDPKTPFLPKEVYIADRYSGPCFKLVVPFNSDMKAAKAAALKILGDNVPKRTFQEWTWEPPKDQEWFQIPGRPNYLARQLMEPKQQDFARFAAERIQASEVPALQNALSNLEKSVFAWQALEALGLGGCFNPQNSLYLSMLAEGRITHSAFVRSDLAAGRLHSALDSLKPDTTQKKKPDTGKEQICERLPRFVRGGLGNISAFQIFGEAQVDDCPRWRIPVMGVCLWRRSD